MPVKVLCFFLLLIFVADSGKTQIPLGSWREHLPYRNALQIAISKEKVYCSTPFSLMVLNGKDNVVERLSKINGLSEIGIATIAASELSGAVVIAYRNSNIDIIEGNSIFNINDILLKNTGAGKNINAAWWHGDQVYLSAGLGIIVLDGVKHQVKDTYVIGDGGGFLEVNAVAANASYLYAATSAGLKRGALNTNLADYRQWITVDSGTGLPRDPAQDVVSFNNRIVALVSDTLWQLEGNLWRRFYSDGNSIWNLQSQGSQLILRKKNELVILRADGTILQRISSTANLPQPLDAGFLNGDVFIADSLAGLMKLSSGNYQSFSPQAPGGISDGEIISSSNNVWVAAGGISSLWTRKNRAAALFHFTDENWQIYDSSLIAAFSGKKDIVTIAEDQLNGGVWAGSFGDGLFRLEKNNNVLSFKENSFIKQSENEPGFYGVGGLAFDKENNLWITNYGAAASLIVRKQNGNTRSFFIPGASFDFAFTRILIDDENQKWIIAPKNNGLFCFNSGADVDNPSDDRWKHYLQGSGNGNLPDNNVLSIAKDRSGFIWVGTAKGIGIIQCTANVFTNQSCEAELPIVQQDNFAGYLFGNEQVQTIAVDAADRKWIGTKNGAWLLSKYGEKTLLHFTTANSRLIDNDVKSITIDPSSGEVFFETAQGICSYRSDATAAEVLTEKAIAFPNPVPPGYTGTIAIKGLPGNSIVKITTLDGRLVHQGRANGSSFTWNGLNYLGQSIASGVYLVLASDDTGKDQLATKIVIVK